MSSVVVSIKPIAVQGGYRQSYLAEAISMVVCNPNIKIENEETYIEHVERADAAPHLFKRVYNYVLDKASMSVRLSAELVEELKAVIGWQDKVRRLMIAFRFNPEWSYEGNWDDENDDTELQTNDEYSLSDSELNQYLEEQNEGIELEWFMASIHHFGSKSPLWRRILKNQDDKDYFIKWIEAYAYLNGVRSWLHINSRREWKAEINRLERLSEKNDKNLLLSELYKLMAQVVKDKVRMAYDKPSYAGKGFAS